MSKQSLKTIIQEANERQEAKRIAADKGMTLVELARSNGWKGEVQEFIGVLVSYGSLFDESFSEQLPSLEAHLAERDPESLMVMTEVVGTHLEAISGEIEAGMYQPPSPVEEPADFGELLAETVGEAAAPIEATPAEPLPDAAERAEALLDRFTADSGGAEEAEELLAGLMEEAPAEETAGAVEPPVIESEDLLAELMGEDSPADEPAPAVSEEPAEEEPAEEALAAEPPVVETAGEVEEDSAGSAEVMEEAFVAEASPAEEALDELLCAEQPAVDSEAFAAELEALAETVEPEAVESGNGNNENVAAEAEEDEMSDLLGEDETLPDYLSSYLEAAEPSAEAAGETVSAADDGLEGLLAEADQATGAEPVVEEPSLTDILESGEAALAGLEEIAEEPAEEAPVAVEEPAAEAEAVPLVEEADAVDDMMSAMGSLMDEPEAEAADEAGPAPEEEAAADEEPAVADEPPVVEEEAVAEEEPVSAEAERLPEMESLPPIDEITPAPTSAAAPRAAAGETVRMIAESFIVVRDGVELYRGDDKGDAAMVLREAFMEHGQEGLLLKRVEEREIVRTETREVLMPFSFSVDIQID